MEKILVDAVSYGLGARKPILSDVSLSIDEGQIFYLVGPNGAGKTTLIQMLLGLIGPDNGSVYLNGVEMNPQNRKDLIPTIGVFIEQAAFYAHLSVLENLGLHARYFNTPKQFIDDTVQLLGLTGESHKKAGKLSMGMKQRLGLAMSLVHQPQIIILDEPTNGMDPQGVIEFRSLVQELNASKGCTFFITTHVLSEVEKMADKIGILIEGKLVDSFYREEVLKSYITFETEGGKEMEETIKSFYAQTALEPLYYREGKVIRFLLPVQKQETLVDLHKLSAVKQITLALEHYYLAKQAQKC